MQLPICFFVHSTYSVIRGQTVSWVTLYLLLMNIVIAAVLPNDIVEQIWQEISPAFLGDTFVPWVHPYINYKGKGYRKGTLYISTENESRVSPAVW